MFRSYFFFACALAGLLLVGCSGSSTPELIASYPGGSSGSSYQQPIQQSQIVYTADMRLSVTDVTWAAQQAEDQVYRYGGYVSGSSSWRCAGGTCNSYIYAIPTDHFNAFHDTLLRLGDLQSEHFSGELAGAVYRDWQPLSEIQVTFEPEIQPRAYRPPVLWRPLATLTSAFQVFTTIFGFLIDILIWLVVVVGPFILIGWLVVALVRRSRQSPK